MKLTVKSKTKDGNIITKTVTATPAGTKIVTDDGVRVVTVTKTDAGIKTTVARRVPKTPQKPKPQAPVMASVDITALTGSYQLDLHSGLSAKRLAVPAEAIDTGVAPGQPKTQPKMPKRPPAPARHRPTLASAIDIVRSLIHPLEWDTLVDGGRVDDMQIWGEIVDHGGRWVLRVPDGYYSLVSGAFHRSSMTVSASSTR